jgi:DNA-binding IclR family transcriptional regulator
LTYLSEQQTKTFLHRDLEQWNARAPATKRFTPSKIQSLRKAVRAQGLASVAGMSNPRVAALSAPVFDRDALALSLTVSGVEGAIDISPGGEPARQLKRAAANVSQKLGGRRLNEGP